MSLDSSKGDITIDGRIVLKSAPLLNVDESMGEEYSRLVIKAVGDPVWYLPRVAEVWDVRSIYFSIPYLSVLI